MLLTVIPSCATFVMDRLLTFVGLGAFGLLVQFWHAVFAANTTRPRFVLWRMVAVPVAGLLVVLHVVLAPIVLSLSAAAPWLRFQAGQYVPWSPPSVGEEVTLESDWQPKFW